MGYFVGNRKLERLLGRFYDDRITGRAQIGFCWYLTVFCVFNSLMIAWPCQRLFPTLN